MKIREKRSRVAGLGLATLFCFSPVGGAQEFDADFIGNLREHPKILAGDELFDSLKPGSESISVLVSLRVPAEAQRIAVSSKDPANRAIDAGSGIQFDLTSLDAKNQLRDMVSELIDNVTERLPASVAQVTRKFSFLFGFEATVSAEGLQSLVEMSDVISIEPNRELQAHLKQGIPLMRATTPRSVYTGAGIAIAVTDTGIDTSHPNLGGGGFPNAKVIGGYDTGDNDADPRPSAAGSAHGTAVAGIAAGSSASVGDYIGGVAPNAKLYAIKISYGNSGWATSGAMIAGWEWAVAHQHDNPSNPIMIINTSFGGGRYYSTCNANSPLMTQAALNAVSSGITLFVSSGNDGYCDSMGWPACISNVVSVGAAYDAEIGTVGFCLDPSQSCATTQYYSVCAQYGQEAAWDDTAADRVTSYSNSAPFLGLFAPSHNAYTADIAGSGGYAAGNYTSGFGGTSAASPYAAGAAAVLQHAAKSKTGSYLSPAQVKQLLVTHGDNITDSKVGLVKPRINLAQAVGAISPVAAAGSIVPILNFLLEE